MVKQMHLFLAKPRQSNGNLSKASSSLAPPGYSFHGIGDFDVGKIGLGLVMSPGISRLFRALQSALVFIRKGKKLFLVERPAKFLFIYCFLTFVGS